jgi:beta-glucosidase
VNKQATLAKSLGTPINYVADAPGGDSALYEVAVTARLDVTNDGPYDGTEIVQLYLLMPAEAENPTKILRGFDNVLIRDGETQSLTIYLTRKDISYWDVVRQTWTTANGTYIIFVGASSSDIRLQGTFSLP